jgi:dihydrofolate synthase/folylpolyglutamate synthase
MFLYNFPVENLDEINSSSGVFKWISRFINLESGQSRRTFRLDRMEILAEAAGHPERSAPVIHVAGSKGKGTVTGMIAAILERAGIKTARYTSPDLGDRRERITLGNVFFDEEVYVEAGKELVKAEEEVARAFPFNSSKEGEQATFFELMTLYFFLCARKARCSAMAVETGMGGRLDATNIVDPLLSIITLIEKEHTEYLGNTIGEIAGEKAGIIKKGKPLILAGQPPDALEVFREKVKLMGSSLYYLPECAIIENIRLEKGGTRFMLSFPPSPSRDYFIPIPGEVQAQNAALAILAVKTAFPGLDPAPAALAGFALPARFERICAVPAVIIDGAHTAKSVEMCVKTFGELYGRGILLFGCAEGKDSAAMAQILVPHFSHIIITAPGTFKKSKPEETFEAFKTAAGNSSGIEVFFIPDTNTAIKRALETGERKELPILGTGSFYLAAEIRGLLLRNDLQ